MTVSESTRPLVLAVLITFVGAAVLCGVTAVAVIANGPTDSNSKSADSSPTAGQPILNPARNSEGGRPVPRAVVDQKHEAPPADRRGHENHARVSSDKEGEEWTHRELAGFLVSRGIQVERLPSTIEADKGPAAWLFDRTNSRGGINHDIQEDYIVSMVRYGSCSAIWVQKCAAAQDARDRVGISEGGHSWGRFLFSGNRNLADRVEAALLGRPLPQAVKANEKTPAEQILEPMALPPGR